MATTPPFRLLDLPPGVRCLVYQFAIGDIDVPGSVLYVPTVKIPLEWHFLCKLVHFELCGMSSFQTQAFVSRNTFLFGGTSVWKRMKDLTDPSLLRFVTKVHVQGQGEITMPGPWIRDMPHLRWLKFSQRLSPQDPTQIAFGMYTAWPSLGKDLKNWRLDDRLWNMFFRQLQFPLPGLVIIISFDVPARDGTQDYLSAGKVTLTIANVGDAKTNWKPARDVPVVEVLDREGSAPVITEWILRPSVAEEF